jgi:hypothetical protein
MVGLNALQVKKTELAPFSAKQSTLKLFRLIGQKGRLLLMGSEALREELIFVGRYLHSFVYDSLDGNELEICYQLLPTPFTPNLAYWKCLQVLILSIFNLKSN